MPVLHLVLVIQVSCQNREYFIHRYDCFQEGTRPNLSGPRVSLKISMVNGPTPQSPCPLRTRPSLAWITHHATYQSAC